MFCFLFFQSLSAQKEKDSLIIKFNLTFGETPLKLNKTYISKNNDTLQLSAFKFYISDLKIGYADNTSFIEKNSHHLIDIENSNSLQLPLCLKNGKVITRIFFNIGVDSVASTSGALAGDLDPTKGMYWAWQSGYINMKIEGKSASCKTRKNEFHFHIGGYKQPFYAIRKVDLYPISQSLDVIVDGAEIFSEIKLNETNSIMIPGKQALELANYSVAMFKTE
jgi:hypothetical protein